MIDFGILLGSLMLGVVVVALPVLVWRKIFGWPRSRPKRGGAEGRRNF